MHYQYPTVRETLGELGEFDTEPSGCNPPELKDNDGVVYEVETFLQERRPSFT